MYLHSFLNWALFGGEWAVQVYAALRSAGERALVPVGSWVTSGPIWTR